MEKICGFAPATIANMSVGFDVLGLALNGVGDRVEIAFNLTDSNRIIAIENGGNLPFDPEKNSCTVVIRNMQEALGDFRGVDCWITKGFASGSGMGSSSASSAAAAFAYNELMGKPFSRMELIPFAAEGERAACGTAHTDNVAPALLGGLVLSNGNKAGTYLRLPLPEGLHVVTLFPHITINTADSRKVLKNAVPVGVMSQQVALMGNFVASLYTNDLKLFAESLKDVVIEPVRSLLIPLFDEMKAVALENGALAFGISGSGPTVFAFTHDLTVAKQVQQALENCYKPTGIATQSYIDALVENQGARLL